MEKPVGVTTLTFEAWTLPSSASYEYLFTFEPIAGAGTRELSTYQDCQVTMPASDPKTRQLAGKWIRVKLGDTYIHGFEAARLSEVADRPSHVTVAGPPLNGVLEWIATYPKNWPNDKAGAQDWVWGGAGVLPPLGLGDLASTKAVFELEIDASAGTFTVTVDGDTTEALAFDVSARNLEGWATPGIQGLDTVQDVTVTGEGSEEAPFVITFYDPPAPGSVTVDDSNLTGSATLTLVTEGGLDPAPVTISKPADQQAGDPADYGNYGTPALEVDTDTVDTGADYSVLVHALTQFAGSQVTFDVIPGETYSGTKVRVRPTAAGNFAIVARTIFGDLIARSEVALTADTFQDLTLPVWTAPAGSDQAILRVAAVDSDPENIDDFYVNWQGAELFQGDAPSTATEILTQLLEAAQDRGTATWLHIATDELDEDTNGTSLDDISFAAFFGGNAHLGHVAADLDKRGYKTRVVDCDHEIEGVTLCLEIYYAPDGTIEDLTDVGDPTILAGTKGVSEAETATRTSHRNVLLGHGAGALTVEVTDAAAIAAEGRRERIIDAETAATEAGVTDVLNTQIAADQANAKAASAVVTALNPTVPTIDYGEGSKVVWQFPGLLTKQERTVARVSWEVGTPARFQVQGSRILDPAAALNQSVNKLLNPLIRRRTGDGGGTTVALPAPSDTSTGAHIHLNATESQEIPSGGGAIEWASTMVAHPARNFPVDLPVDDVPVQLPGYYDFGLDFAWDTWLRGGTVVLQRTRAGSTTTVWPPGTQWTAPAGRTCLGLVAKGIECQPGDTFQWVVDHGDESAQDLAWAYTSIELVDRTTPPVASPSTVDVAYATYENNVADLAEPHEVPLPSHESGDLLCMVIHSDSGVSTINTPSGWTQLGLSTGSNGRAGWFCKVSAGTEGSSVDVTTDAGEGFRGLVAITWRVRSSVDYSSEGPAFDDVNGSLTVPSVAANHGNARYLSFVAVGSKRTYDWSGPDGYTPIVEERALGELSGNVEIVCYLASAEVVTSGTVTPGTIAFGGQTGGGGGVEYRPGHVLVKVGDA